MVHMKFDCALQPVGVLDDDCPNSPRANSSAATIAIISMAHPYAIRYSMDDYACVSGFFDRTDPFS